MKSSFRSQKICVSAIPSGPFITPSTPALISAGDQIHLNCSVFGSRPLPTINWYINRTPVPVGVFTYLQEAVSKIHTKELEDGRLDCFLQLKFRVRAKHFQVILESFVLLYILKIFHFQKPIPSLSLFYRIS